MKKYIAIKPVKEDRCTGCCFADGEFNCIRESYKLYPCIIGFIHKYIYKKLPVLNLLIKIL